MVQERQIPCVPFAAGAIVLSGLELHVRPKICVSEIQIVFLLKHVKMSDLG